MNISSNPWSFTSADVASSTAAASPGGMIQAGAPAYGTVTYTTSGGAHGLSVGQHVTYISDTNGRFLGHYVVASVVSTTVALLTNLSSPSSGAPFNSAIAASGGGTMLVCQYPYMIRAEDISVQAGPGSSQTAGELQILDKNGSLIWTSYLGATPTGLGSVAQNRGKIMWVNGLTLEAVPAGYTVLVTVN